MWVESVSNWSSPETSFICVICFQSFLSEEERSKCETTKIKFS